MPHNNTLKTNTVLEIYCSTKHTLKATLEEFAIQTRITEKGQATEMKMLCSNR